MKNTLPLLVLIRLEPATYAEQLFSQLRQRLKDTQGLMIDQAAQQALWYCPDPLETFDIVRAFFEQGQRHRFTISAGVVQAVASTPRVAESAADFTEQTISTLIELTATAGPQQVAVSTKLLSMLSLAIPKYAEMFFPGAPPIIGANRLRSSMLMDGERLLQSSL